MEEKKNKNGVRLLATASDIGDMMADKISYEERFGIRANPIVEEMDRMDERIYGK